MLKAERESREQESLSGAPSLGGLSQEGYIRLPTNEVDLSRLGLAYMEAAVATCEAAVAAVGGHDSPAGAAADYRRVPRLSVEVRLGWWKRSALT